MISFKNFPVKNKTLTNLDINDYAKKLNIRHFIGHRMRDELVGKPKNNECCIVNCDLSSGNGTQYVCYF